MQEKYELYNIYHITVNNDIGILKIEDISNLKLEKNIILEINENITNKDIKDILVNILSKEYSQNQLYDILYDIITNNKDINSVLKLGSLDITDYGLYFGKYLLNLIGLDNNYCFIGGQILKYYNVFRMTSDTDILVLYDANNYNNIIQNIKQQQLDIQNITNHQDSDPIGNIFRITYKNIHIDILSVSYQFQKEAINNAIVKKLSNEEKIKIISLKDLIVFKMYGFSTKDLTDIQSLLKNNKLLEKDIIYIQKKLNELPYNYERNYVTIFNKLLKDYDYKG